MEEKVKNIFKYVKSKNLPSQNPSGLCFYYALAAYYLYDYPIIAGSLQWRFKAVDDGISATHFSYMFQPNSSMDYYREVKLHNDDIINTALPEMHCWNLDRRTNKALDVTTKFLPEQCEKIIGEKWTYDRPPEWHFGPFKHKNLDYLYTPSSEATQLITNQVILILRKWKRQG